jgi:hypothetical protein
MGNRNSTKKKALEPVKLVLNDGIKKTGLMSLIHGSSVDSYENFYKKLVGVPDDDPVDIIITTHGGSVIWCHKICNVLKNRKGQSRVFVKSYAHSAGTVISLSASQFFIMPYASLSAIDAQGFPLMDLLQTSIQGLPKLINNPQESFLEMSAERAKYFRDIVETCVNDKIHNKNLIMKIMHDEVPIHEKLFFKEDFDNIGIKYNLWSGDEKKLPKFQESNTLPNYETVDIEQGEVDEFQ